MPQLRQNIITGEWVVIAPERAKRPGDFVIPKSVKITDKSTCPFCHGTEGYKTNPHIHGAGSENFYVIENKYPAFISDPTEASSRSFYPEEGFYRARPSVGKHEVVVAKNHDIPLTQFPKPLTNELLEVLRNRYISIAKRQNSLSIIPIYNHGAEAGASLEHPHAQIFASGVVATSVGFEQRGANRYYGINGACVFCDIVKHELKEKIRIVYQNSKFVATTFYASRFPFEIWIYPKKHESQFELTSKASMAELSDALMEVLAMLNKTLDNPPLNLYIHTLPAIEENADYFHWHVEITPRLSKYGGFELGSDIVIDVMSPEDAAEYLRHSKKG